MAEIIINTSPLQYLNQAGLLELLPKLFDQVIVPESVMAGLAAGRQRGISLPKPETLDWIKIQNAIRPISSLTSWDLGAGELAVIGRN